MKPLRHQRLFCKDEAGAEVINRPDGPLRWVAEPRVGCGSHRRGSVMEVAMNSAAYLLKFFLGEGATSDSETFMFGDLSAAMAEVDEALSAAAASGDKEAGSAAKCIWDLWWAVGEIFHRDKNRDPNIPIPQGAVELSNECEMALRIAKRLLGDKVNVYPKERRDSVRELVGSLPDALEPLSVPSELKRYVLLLAHEVQVALDLYDTTGDFKLDAAFSRLQSSLFVVATSSTKPEQHKSFMSFLTQKLLPCITAVSVTLGVPQAAINDINLFAPQIGHSDQQTSAEKHQPGARPTAPGSEAPAAQQ